MNEKKKKTPESSTTRKGFLIRWIGGTWLASVVGIPISGMLLVPLFIFMEAWGTIPDAIEIILSIILLSVPTGILMGLVQQHALKRHFAISIKSWWWMTGLLWVIGGFFWSRLNISPESIIPLYGYPQKAWLSSLEFIVVLSLVGIGQAWLLRKYIPQAWMYGFASVISGIIWSMALYRNTGLFWVFAPALSAIVSALALLWLTSPITGRLSIDQRKSKSNDKLS